MATGKELARSEELRAAAEAITQKIRAGDARGAETAMALYAPPTQALIVRSAFVDALSQQLGTQPRKMRVDAIHRAGREAERVLETVASDAADVVARLDHQVVGAMISAAAGEASSSAAHLVSPERIEDLLASDLELWTEEVSFGEEPADEGERRQSINVRHLIHTLWTIFQTDDERARAFLDKLNLDLVAYPIAFDLLDRIKPDNGGDAEADEDVVVDEDADVADMESGGDAFFAALRAAEEEGPSSLGFADGDLVQLLEEIYRLSPETYRRVLARAAEMDLKEVRAQLMADAAERASGEEAIGGGADDMFTPLDPPTDTPPKKG